jgi:hypothetical protein
MASTHQFEPDQRMAEVGPTAATEMASEEEAGDTRHASTLLFPADTTTGTWDQVIRASTAAQIHVHHTTGATCEVGSVCPAMHVRLKALTSQAYTHCCVLPTATEP